MQGRTKFLMTAEFGNLTLVNKKSKNETKQNKRRTHKLYVHVSEIYLSWKQIFFRPSLGCHVVSDYAKESFVWQLLTLICKTHKSSFKINTQEKTEFPTAVEVTLDFFLGFLTNLNHQATKWIRKRQDNQKWAEENTYWIHQPMVRSFYKM